MAIISVTWHARKPLKSQFRKRPTTITRSWTTSGCWCAHPAGIGAGQTISGLCQPPDLFATAWNWREFKSQWAQGQFSRAAFERPAGQANAFAVGGCHPHKGKVSCSPC